MYGLAGQMNGPFFDASGNPMPAGTTVTCDDSGNCVTIPGLTPSTSLTQLPADTNPVTGLPYGSAPVTSPSVTNPMGSPTMQSAQTWLYVGLGGMALVLLFMATGRRG